MYCNLVKAKYYFQFYKTNAALIDRIISIIIAVISSASVASWLIWQRWTFVWAAIIALSNLLTILKPYLPYEKRVSAVNYMLPELKIIINDVEHYYNIIVTENVSDSDINNHIKTFRQKYTELENKFIDIAIFPDNPHIAAQAEILAANELTTAYSAN
jgi:hypothetical protein